MCPKTRISKVDFVIEGADRPHTKNPFLITKIYRSKKLAGVFYTLDFEFGIKMNDMPHVNSSKIPKQIKFGLKSHFSEKITRFSKKY